MVSSNYSLRGLFFSVLFLSLWRVAEAEHHWVEIRSPHFRVLTDGSSKDGRKVADEFEQMRHVFALRFHTDDIEPSTPLTIVAAKGEDSFEDLEPFVRKQAHGRIAGTFTTGWERSIAVVRLDLWGDENQRIAYQEYTHSILQTRMPRVPTWLDQGLADFYGSTRFEGDRILIGAPSIRIASLSRSTILPVHTMLGVNIASPYYRDPQKAEIFYAESWAMVEYMIFGPSMEGGDKLDKFVRSIEQSVPEATAFQDAFGSEAAFDKAFSEYFENVRDFKVGVLPSDSRINSSTFAERKLTAAEAAYETACVQISNGDRADGRNTLETAIHLDPSLAAAHEEMGYLNFDAGMDMEALQEWKAALADDPTRAISLFASTMMGPAPVEQSINQLEATRGILRHVNELAPKYAPAFAELAVVEWRLGEMQPAYKAAHEAETLEPQRAGYRLLTGHLMLHGNQAALAAEYARYVAAHWVLSDHDEAVDLFDAVPLQERGAGAPLAMAVPAGSQTVRGRILDVSCSTVPGEKLAVTLMPDGPAGTKPVVFKREGRKSNIGFSDTLWWGKDHFSACHHLNGRRAVVVYNKQSGEFVEVEVRDDLPDDRTIEEQVQGAPSAAPVSP